MNRVFITGPGRSCTNWVNAILRLSNKFSFKSSAEDRDIFNSNIPKLPNNYMLKLATEWYLLEELEKLLTDHKDFKVLFCTRHPVDLAMAKIVRGRPQSKGGDGSDKLASDATVEGAIESIQHANHIMRSLAIKFNDRYIQVRLEELLNNMLYEILILAGFLHIRVNDAMLSAYAHTYNTYHQNRYGATKDMSQYNTRSRWDTVYNKFFADKLSDIEILKKELSNIAVDWNYNKQTIYTINLTRQYIET